ncbi:MAG TPA: hypothetical protein VGY66_26765 [Gemmataceae bacterium]|jgi:hypothetical protein|nr:hypothetical protein [Gemmataceae bacterium]
MRKIQRLGISALLLSLLTPLAGFAGQATSVPPGIPVTITVVPGAAPPPPVSITLGARHAHVTPERAGFTHTGAGNIDVAQPSPDVVVVTMTGVAVAGGHPAKASLATMSFDLTQAFEVSFDNPKVKKAKVSIEGKVIGLLRSERKGCGTASEGPGCTSITSDNAALATLCVPEHSVAAGENLSINDHDGPVEVAIVPGKYTLHQTFVILATHNKSLRLTKAVSSEFAPDPALDPLWISYWEPFHGAAKKDFGLQVTIKVAEDTSK